MPYGQNAYYIGIVSIYVSLFRWIDRIKCVLDFKKLDGIEITEALHIQFDEFSWEIQQMAFIALDVDVLRLEFWALLSELKEFQKDKVIYLKGQCHEKLKLISQYRTT